MLRHLFVFAIAIGATGCAHHNYTTVESCEIALAGALAASTASCEAALERTKDAEEFARVKTACEVLAEARDRLDGPTAHALCRGLER